MSMLDRYRRAGGFVQLLNLLETCGPTKQAKFLELISAESPLWAEAIKKRVIDVNRVFNWQDDVLAEIVGAMQDLSVAVILQSAPELVKARIQSFLSHSRRRKIEDLYVKNPPTPAEVTTMHQKMIDVVRTLVREGRLRFDKFDPDLIVEDGIEDALRRQDESGGAPAPTSKTSEAATNTPAEIAYSMDSGGGDRTMEVAALKKKLADVAQENAVLRHELNVARTKLEQIKKIA